MLKALLRYLTFPFILLLGLSFVWYFVTQPTLVKSAKEWNPLVDKTRLSNHVRLLSSSFPERSDDVDKLNVSAAYILKQFKKYSPKVSYQEFEVWGVGYKNIVAKFGPETGKLYVVGAHYDSYHGFPGADDNASGVAGLLELARLFSISKPSKQIHLVAYALEEPPYFRTEDMGSYRHARELKESNADVALMISLEMIGYFDENKSQRYPVAIMQPFYPSKANFISVIGRIGDFSLTKYIKVKMREAAPLEVYSINAPAIIPGVDFSDHMNYWYFEYPAIMITDTAFYRNDNYHSTDDTWETLDYQKMSMVVQGVYHALLAYSPDN